MTIIIIMCIHCTLDRRRHREHKSGISGLQVPLALHHYYLIQDARQRIEISMGDAFIRMLLDSLTLKSKGKCTGTGERQKEGRQVS